MFKNELSRLRILRFGAILGNYAILGGVLLFILGLLPVASVFFYLAALLVYVLIILIWLLTFGQLFSFPDTSWLNASGPVFEWFSKFAHAAAPYLFPFTAVFAVISLIIVILDKRPHAGRIATSSVALGLAVIGMILVYVAGGISI